MIIFPDISPDIFSVSIGNFELALRWYAMSYILGIILGWRLAVLTIRRSDLWPKNQAPMEPVQIEDLLTYVVIGVIVGGRLGYVIFYKPMEYAANPFDIIKVWQGGMSFHGGLLGVVLATFIYYRRNLVPLLSGADLLALCAPIGLMLGRIANFINAELWGRPTDMPWGVAFPERDGTSLRPSLRSMCASPLATLRSPFRGSYFGTHHDLFGIQTRCFETTWPYHRRIFPWIWNGAIFC